MSKGNSYSVTRLLDAWGQGHPMEHSDRHPSDSHGHGFELCDFDTLPQETSSQPEMLTVVASNSCHLFGGRFVIGQINLSRLCPAFRLKYQFHRPVGFCINTRLQIDSPGHFRISCTEWRCKPSLPVIALLEPSASILKHNTLNHALVGLPTAI